MDREDSVRIALVSLGCPKNLVDSERMLAHLAEAGCVVGAPLEDADVIVVNTCGFLQAAREESLEAIAEAVARKDSGRARRVVVAGCLVQREAEQLFEVAPGIDAVVGVNSRDEITDAVLGRGPPCRIAPAPSAAADDSGRFLLTQPHSAYLRIAEGCSQRCSFCTIPAIRGPMRSKPPEAVLAEASELIASGVVEMNLIAQDTTSYGRDLAEPASLSGLLGQLDALDGARWIRLMYAYPVRFDDALIDAMARCARVVPYVDLPLQHIADGVLARMRRGVTRRATEDLIARLRDRVAGLSLRTTFIVGFPGESEEEFQELLDFVRDSGFDAVGVFEFSPEPGTPAAEMPGQVSPDAVADRAQELMRTQREIVLAANAARVGREIEVLVDGVDEDGYCFARHAGQAPDVDSVCYLTRPRPEGTFVTGRVADYDEYDLIVAADDDGEAEGHADGPERRDERR